MKTSVANALQQGTGPADDGWYWLYRTFDTLAPQGSLRRSAFCTYYTPSKVELANNGRLYRWLGVALFGRFIPTGGIAVRRATGTRMAPYTLARSTVSAARDFYYRACVFESLHFPFFVALLLLAVQRASIGRIDYAIQETILNLLVNVYPMLHHRNTRRRIYSILANKKNLIGDLV
ncbi:MAG: hypothetical protein OEM64_00220 [Gammaproteobacteria bacterium]|nr:hypothetical protein [Gammaproteobacteria bacterium]MDH3414709.1 hypothetical protein [Gammaproteobacteria bacterium]